MKWILISEQFPELHDEIKILVSDGKEVWISYVDHSEFWIISFHRENDDEIINRLTHWTTLDKVPLPKIG